MLSRKTKITIFILVILLLSCGFLFWYYKPLFVSSNSSPYVEINNQIISVELADTQAEHIQGLSGRLSLCPNCGMLFIFKQKQIRSFWMRNMHFPLDIIWLNNNKIVNISHNLLPEGEHPARTYSSKAPVNYVLEINAGIVDEYNIKIGDTVKFNF